MSENKKTKKSEKVTDYERYSEVGDRLDGPYDDVFMPDGSLVESPSVLD